MPLFAPSKKRGVQGFILKLVNNNCPELKALLDGPRLARRVNLTVVVLVIPVEKKKLCLGRAFFAVSKEFSNTGMAVVLDEPRGPDEVVLGFRWEAEMTFIRGKAKHLNPMGGGFYQLGFQLTEIVSAGDYCELQSLSF